MGLMAFIRRRLGQREPGEIPSELPHEGQPPSESALVPVGPPKKPRPSLAVELPLPDEPTPPTELRGREPEP
jgi:hypothetical protein